MRLSRIMIAITAGVALWGVPTAAGAAQPFTPQPSEPTPTTPPATVTPQPPAYPPTEPSLTSPDPTVLAGDPVTIVGNNFGANELVRLTFSVLPTAAGPAGPAAPAVAPAPPANGGVGAMAPLADGPGDGRHSPWPWPTRTHHSPSPSPTNTGDGGYCRGSHRLPRPITVRADGDGHFTTVVRICRTGSIQVTATGLRTGDTASLVLTIFPRGAGSGSPLPVTGGSIVPQLTFGVAAVVLGALLILLTVVLRRRRGRTGARVG
ncbi:hypothetical protein ACFFWC_19670 [Plantactinospora siamensis]|uniref:IPT/TIG domain-containing protein n=1 Tax=Plantactinospora siamensis TaxID=555372 RepID=A0ABV6P2P6_9ACTN